MKTYLKIKIKTLAAEARIIRAEEHKWPGPSTMRNNLHHHRVISVRHEARASLLAYGFLRGHTYQRMEKTSHTKPYWKRIESIAERFGTGDIRDLKQKFSEWKDAADSYRKEV